jgi:hypothetical protein
MHPLRLRRAFLRRAALRYAAAGWDVIPGACLVRGRFDCGQPGCFAISCHPAVAEWERLASHDPAAVRSWWRGGHYGVLLATGRAFDVLEVPAALGAAAAVGCAGPVAVSPTGRLSLLVRRGAKLHPQLRRRPDVVLHGRGSWVPLPPTEFPDGRMRWLRSPQECGWRLPGSDPVQQVLLDKRSPVEARSLPAAA